MSFSTPSLSSLNHLPPSEQLCYLHCNLCDTVLAVSVPCTILFTTVTVRCGHCTNLLPVNTRGLLLSSANQLHFGHTFFSPAHNLLMQEDISNPSSNFLGNKNHQNEFALAIHGGGLIEPPPKGSVTNRTQEKRQRVPSAYNRFIKEEIQRIKAVSPDITHREAFSTAAKNWAHFPHIHYGFMPDHTAKKATIRRQDDLDDVHRKDAFFASANLGVSHTN